MKKLVFALLCVILLSGNTPQRDKIYVQENKTLGLMLLYNTYNQDIFCVRNEKGRPKKFYVLRNSKSAPFPKTKFWCALPDKKV